MRLPDYQFFGSKNSQDIDVTFFVTQLPPSIQERALLNKEYCELLKNLHHYTKPVNGNLAVAQDGCLTSVFKGTIDELNNALFSTYPLHYQCFENKIKKLLERDIDLKFLRCARTILSYFTKTMYRKEIKSALDGDIDIKYEVLKQPYFSELLHKQVDTDVIKSIAFQLGQTLGLEAGQEFYTKDDIAAYFPPLTPFLMREKVDNKEILLLFFERFLTKLEARKQVVPKKRE